MIGGETLEINMKIHCIKDFNNLDICDSNVTNVDYGDDAKNPFIYLELDGAIYLRNETRELLGPGHIKLYDFIESELMSYNASKNEKIKLPTKYVKNISNICKQEIIQVENRIVLSGYEKITNNWLELKIIGGEVTGEFISK